MKKINIIPYIIFLSISVILIGCSLGRQLAPIETPGAIDRITRGNLPYTLADWQYNEDWLLLESGGYPSEAVAALINWSTGELEPLNLPDLGLEPKVQGPNNLIAYTSYPDDLVIIFNRKDQSTFPVADGFMGSFSSDGEYIAIIFNRKLFAVNITDRSKKVIWESINNEKVRINNVNWIPGSPLVAFSYEIHQSGSGYQGESFLVVDSNTGETFKLVENEKIFDMTVSPDGRLLVYIWFDSPSESELRIMDIRNQCLVGSKEMGFVHKVEWSPKGDKLAVTY